MPLKRAPQLPDDFEDLVNRYYEDLYRFAYSLAKVEADAADLTQETFYIFAQKGHQINERAKAKSWLFTTLYREFLRKRSRDGRLVFAADGEPYSSEDATDSTVDRDADGSAVLSALSLLDESYRAPLTLFYLEGFAYREIAEVLDIPIGTVMSRLSRGKEALRQAMADPKLAERMVKMGQVVPLRRAQNT